MSEENIKYRYNFNFHVLRGITSKEMDILMVILSRIRDQKEKEIMFTFEELRTLSNYKDPCSDRFSNDLLSLSKKLPILSYELEVRYLITIGPLFPFYIIDTQQQTFELHINEDFLNSFNKMIDENWTRIELEDFINLKSRYAISLYLQLIHWKNKGNRAFSMEEFRYLLDVPASYQVSKVDRKVLNPCMRELSSCFENLRMEKLYDRHHRGRPSVNGYRFTWKPDSRISEQEPEIGE
jgi:plasmid replication initiation protein